MPEEKLDRAAQQFADSRHGPLLDRADTDAIPPGVHLTPGPVRPARPPAAAGTIDLGPGPAAQLLQYAAERFLAIARLGHDDPGAAVVAPPHFFAAPEDLQARRRWILRGGITAADACEQRRRWITDRSHETVVRRKNEIAQAAYRDTISRHNEEPRWVKEFERGYQLNENKEAARLWRAVGPEEEEKLKDALAQPLEIELTGWGQGIGAPEPSPSFRDRVTGIHLAGQVTHRTVVLVAVDRLALRDLLLDLRRRAADVKVIVTGWDLNRYEAQAIAEARAVYARPDPEIFARWLEANFPKAKPSLLV